MIRPQANTDTTTSPKNARATPWPRCDSMINGSGYCDAVTVSRSLIPSVMTTRNSVPTPPLMTTDQMIDLGTVAAASTVSSERLAADSKPTSV